MNQEPEITSKLFIICVLWSISKTKNCKGQFYLMVTTSIVLLQFQHFDKYQYMRHNIHHVTMTYVVIILHFHLHLVTSRSSSAMIFGIEILYAYTTFRVVNKKCIFFFFHLRKSTPSNLLSFENLVVMSCIDSTIEYKRVYYFWLLDNGDVIRV